MQNNNTAVSVSLTVEGITLGFADISWARVCQIVEFITGGGAETVSSPEKGGGQPGNFASGCLCAVRRILDYADRHPTEVDYRYLSSHEFRDAYSELAEYDIGQIGRTIRDARKSRPEILKSTRFNKDKGQYENLFYLPVSTDSTETEAILSRVGTGYRDALRKAMQIHDMDARDIAILTGYPIFVVNGWIEGKVLPTTVAFGALRKLFGKDFLAKKED